MIILVDKPKGITSFDVIRRLRKELGIKKMGHAGTLDPLATGLLIIGTDDDTKNLTKLIGLPKTYQAEILLGQATDSGDSGGKIIQEMPVPEFTTDEVARLEIEKVLVGMKGTLTLPVSIFSAIKRDGVPLYKYAHKGQGQDIEKPMRDMVVRDAKLISCDFTNKFTPKITAVFDVSSGTYIRSLAEELGRRLETCAHITELRRLSIGDYKVSDARQV